MIEQTLPPITNGEIKFYQQQILVKYFNNDTNPGVSNIEPLPAGPDDPEEPVLQFSDFLFLLSLIAYTTITSRKTIEDKLIDLYSSKLNLGKLDTSIVDEDYNFEEILARTEAGTTDVDFGEESDEDGDLEQKIIEASDDEAEEVVLEEPDLSK